MSALEPRSEHLRALVARMGRERLVAELLEAAVAIPGYREFLPGGLDVEAVTRWNVDLLLRVLLDGRPASPDDLEVLREVVRARAVDGMAPSTLLAPYRVGSRRAWELLAAAAEGPERDALLDAAGLLLEHADALSATIVDAFTDEREALASEDERRARALLAALASPAGPTAEDRLVAERLGVGVQDGQRPFALVLAGRPAREHAELATALRLRGALAASEGSRVVGVAPAPLDVGPLGRAGPLVAAGAEPVGRGELAGALDDLRALCAIAVARGRRGVVALDDHLPELLLARTPALRDRVVARVLGALAEQPELARTLRELVRHDFDRAATAAALPVHRNTLGARVARIEALCALDLDATAGRALAWLAVGAVQDA